jgi:hypothetical protein
MSKDIQARYEDQLPKKERLSFDRFFGYCTGTASIAGLVAAPFFVKDQGVLSYLYMVFLSILVIVLIIHAALVEQRKLHRYAQSVFYYHFAQHIVRDSLAELSLAHTVDPKITTEKILNAIANCFTIISGKNCRASVVELSDKCELSVEARDSMSSIRSSQRSRTHKLDENTDFRNLWYSINGCSRYYLNNDIKRSWLNHNYKNSCFKEYGEPEIKNFFGYTYVCKWTLPYKSALILPIRYISEFRPPKIAGEYTPHWDFYGFLCIDSISENSFDDRYSPELGGGFADILYNYFRQTNFILDCITSPQIK